jgi:hypothetical protein
MLPPDRTKVKVLSTGQVLTLVLGPAASTMFLSASESNLIDGETYDFYVEQGDDWEHSFGVYNGSAGTITRTVIKSKIGNVVGTDLIDLDGATAYLYFPLFQRLFAAVTATGDYYDLANIPLMVLDADTDFHVSLSGDNANDGKTPGTAWRTLQHAANMMARFDADGRRVRVLVHDSAWAENYHYCDGEVRPTGGDYCLVDWHSRPKNCLLFSIIGNEASPGSCIMQARNDAENCYIFVVSTVVDVISGFQFESPYWDLDTWNCWHVGIGIWGDGRIIKMDNIIWNGLSVHISCYTYNDVYMYNSTIIKNFAAFADVYWGRFTFDNASTTVIDPAVDDMDEFVWGSDSCTIRFGNHTFVNPELPYGYRGWVSGNSQIHVGSAVVPGQRGWENVANGSQSWLMNGREWGTEMVLAGDTDFFVDLNGRDNGDGLGTGSGPQFKWATLRHAGNMLRRVDANGFRVRLFVGDGEWIDATANQGDTLFPLFRPRNCSRFEVYGNEGNPDACYIHGTGAMWGYMVSAGSSDFYGNYGTTYGGVEVFSGFRLSHDYSEWWVLGVLASNATGFAYVKNCRFDNLYDAVEAWSYSSVWCGENVQFREGYLHHGLNLYSHCEGGMRNDYTIVGTSFPNTGRYFFDVGRYCWLKTQGNCLNPSNWPGHGWNIYDFSLVSTNGVTLPGDGATSSHNSIVDGVLSNY